MKLLYVIDVYNMNKYFIEYLKNQIYVCFDGKNGYVNLKFEHNNNIYLQSLFLKIMDQSVLLKEYFN